MWSCEGFELEKSRCTNELLPARLQPINLRLVKLKAHLGFYAAFLVDKDAAPTETGDALVVLIYLLAVVNYNPSYGTGAFQRVCDVAVFGRSHG